MYDLAYSFWSTWLYESSLPSSHSYQFFDWTFTGTQLIELISIASCLIVVATAVWVIYKLLSFVLSFSNRW